MCVFIGPGVEFSNLKLWELFFSSGNLGNAGNLGRRWVQRIFDSLRGGGGGGGEEVEVEEEEQRRGEVKICVSCAFIIL